MVQTPGQPHPPGFDKLALFALSMVCGLVALISAPRGVGLCMTTHGACIALSSASIAVMGPQAAINAVYFNQLAAIEDEQDRARRTEELRAEYAEDIDILHLASELVIDAVIEPAQLRGELSRRFAHAEGKDRRWPARHNPVTPV